MKSIISFVSSLALISAATSAPLPKGFERYTSAASMVQHIVINSWSDQEFTGKTKVDIYFDRAVGFHIATESITGPNSDIRHLWKDASGCHAGRWMQAQGVAQQLEYKDTPDCSAQLSNPTDFDQMLLKVLLNLPTPMLSACNATASYTLCTLPDKRFLGLMFKNGYLWRAVLSIDGQRNVLAAELEPPTLRKIYPNELRFDTGSLNTVAAMTGGTADTNAIWKAAAGGSRTALVQAMAYFEMQQTPSDMTDEQVFRVVKRAAELNISTALYALSRMYAKSGQEYLPTSERKTGAKAMRAQLEKYAAAAMRACNLQAIQYLQEGCFEPGCDEGAETPKRAIAFAALHQEQQCKRQCAGAPTGRRPVWARTDFGVSRP